MRDQKRDYNEKMAAATQEPAMDEHEEPQESLTFLRFSLAFALFAAIWCVAYHPPAFGFWVLIYVGIFIVWVAWRILLRLTKPKKTVEIMAKPTIIAPVPVPVIPIPTATERAATAKAKYDETLRLLLAAGLDELELSTARAAAKQTYLREIDEVM